MTRTSARALLVSAVAVTSMLPASSGATAVEPEATVLSASPVFVTNLILAEGDTLLHFWLDGGMAARLTTASSGDPVAGRTLTFTAGPHELCSARTSSGGRASCGSSTREENARRAALVVLYRGYEVGFAGDDEFASSGAEGRLLRHGDTEL